MGKEVQVAILNLLIEIGRELQSQRGMQNNRLAIHIGYAAGVLKDLEKEDTRDPYEVCEQRRIRAEAGVDQT